MELNDLIELFLPYQQRWLSDKSKIKIWEKSRRIGATYVQAFEDVKDCSEGKIPAVWFSSADESAAKEYIEYCEYWAKKLNTASKSIGRVIVDSENDIKALVIEFSNGTKIHALSSNPKAFRSKGGKVVIDEFAHHANPMDLWAAARPCITWGYPLRILSTHNGQSTLFYKFIEDIQKEKLKWSLHTTPIDMAVEEGLVDKIYDRKTTQNEREEWTEEQRKNCFDDYTWRQEYCCEAVDEASAFLPYDLIASCELDNLYKDLMTLKGNLYIGMDIGRTNNPSVIWVIEKLGHVKYTRMIKVIKNTEFHIQHEALYAILKCENVKRCCIDATGMGQPFAEEVQRRFGKYRIIPIKFDASIKEEMAYNLRINFENKTIYIPPDDAIRTDLHSIVRGSTSRGSVHFDADKSDKAGHADRFWALALALLAEKRTPPPVRIKSSMRRESYDLVKNYY